MEPDDFLYSRNARPQKALVGRAQWKIHQPPSLKRERPSLEGSLVTTFDGRSWSHPDGSSNGIARRGPIEFELANQVHPFHEMEASGARQAGIALAPVPPFPSIMLVSRHITPS